MPYQRGIIPSDDTANFIFTRLDRDMATLKEALVKLDEVLTTSKTKSDDSFVKSILDL